MFKLETPCYIACSRFCLLSFEVVLALREQQHSICLVPLGRDGVQWKNFKAINSYGMNNCGVCVVFWIHGVELLFFLLILV